MAKIIFRANVTHKVLHTISGTSLWRRNLSGLDLRNAAMYAIEVTGAQATGNPIIEVHSRKAHLSGANLSHSNLSGAVFSDENLAFVNFTGANLSKAAFVRTHLIGVNLRGANLKGARFWHTSIDGCPSLNKAENLESIEHLGPSALDAGTLRACVADLPTAFLRGVGYTPREIDVLQTLYRPGDEYFSCFISYARSDATFAGELRRRLLKSDISCWQDLHDMLGGLSWKGQIYDAIEKNDKLVLVCSRKSLQRPAVVDEILEAIARERQTEMQKLFPIRIDDFVLSGELDALARKMVMTGEWRENWVSYVRAFHIPDFSDWKAPARFRIECDKLVEALRRPPARPARGSGTRKSARRM